MELVLGSVDARCVSDSFQCSNCLARLNMAECDRVSAEDDIFREEGEDTGQTELRFREMNDPSS